MKKLLLGLSLLAIQITSMHCTDEKELAKIHQTLALLQKKSTNYEKRITYLERKIEYLTTQDTNSNS